MAACALSVAMIYPQGQHGDCDSREAHLTPPQCCLLPTTAYPGAQGKDAPKAVHQVRLVSLISFTF